MSIRSTTRAPTRIPATSRSRASTWRSTPENTEQLIVTFSAVPRVASDGETAKFLLRGGEQSWECEVEGDAGGRYRGSLTIPMVDEYSVYLVLTDRNGGTRNLLIASESDIENRFSIDVQAYWSSGGPTFSFGKNTFTGTLSTYVDVHDALEDTSFTGRIILYQNGKEIAEQPLEYRISDGEYSPNIYDTEVRLGTFDGRMSDFSIKVEITDAYGRVFTVSPIKQAKKSHRDQNCFPCGIIFYLFSDCSGSADSAFAGSPIFSFRSFWSSLMRSAPTTLSGTSSPLKTFLNVSPSMVSLRMRYSATRVIASMCSLSSFSH